MKKILFSALIGITALTIVGGTVALADEMGFGFGRDKAMNQKADILGITADELEAKLETQTFPELLDESGITHEEMHESMMASKLEWMTEKLQTQVDAGNITQEQMDDKIASFEAGDGMHMGGMMKGSGAHGKGPHGPMKDANGDGVCDYMDIEQE